MGLDYFSVDQRHILDEEAQNAFSLVSFDARISPDSWEIGSQGEQLVSRLRVDQQALLLRLLLILCLRLGPRKELVVPFPFQTIGHEAIVGIDIHVPAASEFNLVLGPFNVLPP